MASTYITELEEKIAHYEEIMSRCPQCKASLPAPEAESTAGPSRHARPSRIAQQRHAKIPPPAFTATSKQPAPAATLSPSTMPSKKLHTTSQTEVEASDVQHGGPSNPSIASSLRSHQDTEAPVSTLQQQSKLSSDDPTASHIPTLAVGPSGQPSTSSETLSTGDPPPTLTSADVRRRHSGRLVHLDLQQQYKKPRSRTQVGRPPGESPRHAEWMRTADIMLEEVPSGRQWREKVTKMDSSIIAAVAISATPNSRGNVSPKEDVERKELVRLVRSFAERHSEGRVNFEHFILVCLCKVLSTQGVPQRKVVETLQICISDTSKKNIDGYLKGATWVNRMIDELFSTDWGYRAVDLIVIWNRSVATYSKISQGRDSRQYFITDLTQRKYFEGYQEVPDRRHDTIPWIVKKELGDEISYVVNPVGEKALHTYRRSYRDVCEALGYSEEYFMQTEHLHLSKPSSPDLDAGDSGHVGSTPQSDTFHTARQSTTSVSSLQGPTSVDESPSNFPFSASYLGEMSSRRKKQHQDDSPDHAAGNDPPTGQNVASPRTKRLVPDRSAKPLGDPDIARRRSKPAEITSSAYLPSTSPGASAPGTESAKRPLPESPTSAFQPTTSSRRRHHREGTSSSEEMGLPPRPEKKGSKDQRGRA